MINKRIRSILVYSICFSCSILISLSFMSCKEKPQDIISQKNIALGPFDEIKTYFTVPVYDKGNSISEDTKFLDFISCHNSLILNGAQNNSFKTFSIKYDEENVSHKDFSQSDLTFIPSRLPGFLKNENNQYNETISMTNTENDVFLLKNNHLKDKSIKSNTEKSNQVLQHYLFKEQILYSSYMIPDLLNLNRIRIFTETTSDKTLYYLLASSLEDPNSLFISRLPNQEPTLNFEEFLKTDISIKNWELHDKDLVVLLSNRELLRYRINLTNNSLDVSEKYSVKFTDLESSDPQIFFSRKSNLYLIWDSSPSGTSFYHVENNSDSLFQLPYLIHSVIPIDKTSTYLNLEEKTDNSFLILTKDRISEDYRWDSIGVVTVSKDIYLERFHLKSN